ncbi:MAG: FtsW/RodA/SpoVE family cell cycle protein [Anaerolineae bacterium]|nr:FtsW/RodA/SpoVE family cell cycle protein [Anaerolineae bacterium]
MSTARVRVGSVSGYDWSLVVAVVALIILGLMMVYSATAFHGLKYRLDANPSLLFLKQLAWTALGMIVLVVLARIDYHRWRRFSVLILAGTLALLGLVLILGRQEFGAQRWLIGRLLGAEGGSVQPSELAKLTMILYAADWLASKGERIRQVKAGLIPFAVLLGLVVGLIVLQHHLTSAVIIATNGIVMFFVAGGSIWQMLVCGILGGISIGLLIMDSPYRLERVLVFLAPLSEQAEKGSPIIQNLIALASGGLTGVGIGESRGKFGYVSVPHSDNIFAILGEEMGLIGCLECWACSLLSLTGGFASQ